MNIFSFPGPVPLPMDESGAAIRLDIPQPLPPHGSMQELREDLRTVGRDAVGAMLASVTHGRVSYRILNLNWGRGGGGGDP